MDENNENKPSTNIEESQITNVEKTDEAPEVKTNEKEKNTNFKNEANEAKNFFVDFFKMPLSKIEKIVSSPKSFLKIAIIILVSWIIFECIGSIIEIAKSYSVSPYYTFGMFMRNSISDFFEILIAILIPAISVAALSGIIYLFMKDKKKNYLTIIISILVAKIPVVIASFVSLFGYINSQVNVITRTFSDFCYVISTILVYFAIKALYSEKDDDNTIKTFLIVMAIFFVVVLLLRFFGINIYC